MILVIFDTHHMRLGTVEISLGKPAQFLGDRDAAFAEFFERSLQQGIRMRRDIYDEKEKRFVLIEGPIKENNPLFPFALKEYLERRGYVTCEERPEMKARIMKILEVFPDDDPDARYLLENFDALTYLEQTALVEQLEAA